MDASIELPDGWVDRTVLTYVGPDAGSGSPSLVVTRDDLPDGVTLGRYASMQDAAIRAGLEGVDLVEERETTVAGRPAVRHTYAWTLDGRTIRQRVWCLLRGRDRVRHHGLGPGVAVRRAAAPVCARRRLVRHH